MPMLTETEKKVRETLIKVCRGQEKTRYPRLINYKALWEKYPTGGSWGRGKTRIVVDWIFHIADYDLEHGRPPLNSLVVRTDTREPGANWHDWRKKRKTPYKSLSDAQKACWTYWPEKS